MFYERLIYAQMWWKSVTAVYYLHVSKPYYRLIKKNYKNWILILKKNNNNNFFLNFLNLIFFLNFLNLNFFLNFLNLNFFFNF